MNPTRARAGELIDSMLSKVPAAEVGYREAEGPDRACAVCADFDGDAGCAAVDGSVNPAGVCDLFTPLNQGATP